MGTKGNRPRRRAAPQGGTSTPARFRTAARGKEAVKQRLLSRLRELETKERDGRREAAGVLEALADPVFIFGSQGELVRVNRAALDLLGRRSQPVGSTLQRLLSGVTLKSPTGRPVDVPSLGSRSALRGESERRHFIVTRPDGACFHVEAMSSPLLGEGTPGGAVMVWKDVTERDELTAERSRDLLEFNARVKKRAEDLASRGRREGGAASPRRSSGDPGGEFRQALARVLDGVGFHIAFLDRDFRYVQVNRAYARAAGVSAKALVGQKHFDLFPDPQLRQVFQNALAEQTSHAGYERVVFRPTRPDGVQRHWDWRVHPVSGPDGNVSGIVFCLIDVSGRRGAESSRRLLASTVDQASEAVIIMDARGSIQYANAAFRTLTGMGEVGYLGKRYYDLAGQGLDAKEFGRISDRLFRIGKPWSGRVTRKLPSGREAILDVVLTPLRNAGSQPANISAVERDVTREITEGERRSQVSRARLESLGRLAGGIAHDFNNLLLPIMLNAELALDDSGPDSPAGHRLQTVLLAAKRAKSLVGQILAFSHESEIGQGTFPFQPIVRETLEMVRGTLPREIFLRSFLDAPDGVAEITPSETHQVLMNLCANAVYSMRSGGGTIEVSLSEVDEIPEAGKPQPPRKGPVRYLRLAVADMGEGMSPHVLERIFDPFFTTKAPGEGSGMGLSVVHGIVESRKGTIRVASEPGKGTTFLVFLPLAQASLPPEPDGTLSPSRGTERLLLVDDESAFVQGVRQMLERLGYRVMAETDSRAALDAFAARPGEFDLIIVDQIMPGLSGTALAQEIRRRRPDMPIILWTGFGEAVDEATVKSLGIQDVIRKPFLIKELSELVRRLLDGPRPA